MNHSPSLAEAEVAADRFARRLTARLSEGHQDIPYDISERLRAARVQAVGKRKRPVAATVVREVPARVVVGANGAAALGGWGGSGDGDGEPAGWWRALVSAVPLLALVVGMVVINVSLNDNAEEVAEVDAALLTDDLPPSAYADPGFLQFIKTGGNSGH